MTVHESIWLTAQDYNRLRLLVADLTRQSRSLQAGVETLEEILDFARVVNPNKVPENVVTMNSRGLFEDIRTAEQGTVTVVYPPDVDPTSGKISVLSPVGAALLGETEGSEVELPLPNGEVRRIRIRSVLYQPEAQGDYAL